MLWERIIIISQEIRPQGETQHALGGTQHSVGTTRLSYIERNLKSMPLPKGAYIKSEFSADFKYGNGMFLKIVLFCYRSVFPKLDLNFLKIVKHCKFLWNWVSIVL